MSFARAAGGAHKEPCDPPAGCRTRFDLAGDFDAQFRGWREGKPRAVLVSRQLTAEPLHDGPRRVEVLLVAGEDLVVWQNIAIYAIFRPEEKPWTASSSNGGESQRSSHSSKLRNDWASRSPTSPNSRGDAGRSRQGWRGRRQSFYRLSPTLLAPPPGLPDNRDASRSLPNQLAALGYPGFSHLRKGSLVNPAVTVLDALSERSLDGRVAEAMPWVLEQFPSLDWDWLVDHARRRNVQNRLGFLVTVARMLAQRRTNKVAVERLTRVEEELEQSRLVAETTLGREGMPAAERAWLREHRSPAARHWNVLSGLKLQDLSYA